MKIYFKSFVFLIFFSLLHFGFDLTGWSFLKPFCGTDESIFQHLKMAYWAYLLASLAEYPVWKSRRKEREQFWVPRLFSAVIVPWVIFLVWYLAPAAIGKFRLPLQELAWAVTVSYFSGLAGGVIERNLEEHRFYFCFRILVLFLLIVSGFLYVSFTYHLPWVDVFRAPE